MRVKNTRKHAMQESDFQKAAIAIYRSLLIRLNQKRRCKF